MKQRIKRIQLRRTKGWRMPPNTVNVARPRRWGNRYVIGMSVTHIDAKTYLVENQFQAVRLYREWLNWQIDRFPSVLPELRTALRGRNLACWCKPGTPCHADVLLELANELQGTWKKRRLKMGEAKRRKAAGQYPGNVRSWATGMIEVSANELPCFVWSGTKQEAIELQKQYLESVYAVGLGATSYAKRAAGYLMCFGMPQVGDVDRRPSRIGETWSADEIEVYKAAIVWMALREHIPNTGRRLEDAFVGKRLLVVFSGDRQDMLDYSMRELRGEPLPPEKEFTMMATVLEHEHRLDPRDAVSLSTADLFALAGSSLAPMVARPRCAGGSLLVIGTRDRLASSVARSAREGVGGGGTHR